MVLNIHMKYEEIAPIQFEIIFLGEKKIISSESQDTSFFFDKEGEYEIEIVQRGMTGVLSAMQKLMYFLFLPIIGLFSGLFLYGETMSVFRKINPYLISQKIVLHLVTDTKMVVTYIAPVYDKKLQTWIKPSLLFSNLKNHDNYTLHNNIGDFSNCYLDFKRTFFAICFDVIVFFMVIAFLALQKDDGQAFIVFLILSLSILFLCFITLILVKKKIANMKKAFIASSKIQSNSV